MERTESPWRVCQTLGGLALVGILATLPFSLPSNGVLSRGTCFWPLPPFVKPSPTLQWNISIGTSSSVPLPSSHLSRVVLGCYEASVNLTFNASWDSKKASTGGGVLVNDVVSPRALNIWSAKRRQIKKDCVWWLFQFRYRSRCFSARPDICCCRISNVSLVFPTILCLDATGMLLACTQDTSLAFCRLEQQMQSDNALRLNRPTSVFGYVGCLDGFLVAIPPSRIRTTAASIDYMSRRLARPPSICDSVDHLTCQCIHKLHVNDTEYLTTLRGTIGKQVCCAFCDDLFSRHVLEDAPDLQCIKPISIDGHLIPLERLALTTAVPHLCSIGVASAANICKDHQNGHCSRMKDCSNLHVCRKRMGLISRSSTRPVVSATSKAQAQDLSLLRKQIAADFF